MNDFTLAGSLKKYQRMRRWRSFIEIATLPAGLLIPWYFNFTRTETIICFVGAMLFASVVHLEMRLKTMQIRLAAMADDLDALRGREPEGNEILELSDW